VAAGGKFVISRRAAKMGNSTNPFALATTVRRNST
jgi:hypothetical protein